MSGNPPVEHDTDGTDIGWLLADIYRRVVKDRAIVSVELDYYGTPLVTTIDDRSVPSRFEHFEEWSAASRKIAHELCHTNHRQANIIEFTDDEGGGYGVWAYDDEASA